MTEEIPSRYHLLPEETTQHADVEYNKTATLTFWNAPYGSLRVEKWSDTGDALSGVTIQIKHIETGETRTEQTRNGVVVFDELAPGGWEVRETAGIEAGLRTRTRCRRWPWWPGGIQRHHSQQGTAWTADQAK